jgi:eukaryotic-like serine/threonine-protein kinase
MRRFLKGLAIFLALAGVGIVSAFAVVALLLHQEEVRVPDLRGQDIVNVIETVTQRGLQLKVDRREPHATMPRDTVISQTPTPGSETRKGRQLRVVVSQGPGDMQAPKLVGEHFRKADIMIRRAGFVPGDVARVSSDPAAGGMERDTVIAQEPQAGSYLDRGARINVLVSAGRRSPLLVMPKLTGKKAEDAGKIIDRMGLQRRMTSRTTTTGPQAGNRIVVSQKPDAGYPVASDAMVDIVVSR